MRNRISYIVLSAAVIFLPAVLTLLLVRFHLQGSLSDSIPTYSDIYNDAIYYWRQIWTFSEVGFNSGYYTIYENPAPAGFTHFYVHGPAFPLLYGIPGRLFGWAFFSGPIFNLVLVTAALGFFVYAARLSMKQLIFTGIALATFWPLLLYLPTTMQESLHHGFAIVLAYGFYRLLARGAPLTSRQTLVFGLFIFAAAFTRLTWEFLFIPFFVLNVRVSTLRGYILALVKASIIMLFLFWLSYFTSAPYPFDFLTALIRDFRLSPLQGIHAFLLHFHQNLVNFNAGSLLEIVQRYQVLLITLVCMMGIVFLLRKTEASRSGLSKQEILFHGSNLSLLLCLLLSAYELVAWRDYRVLAAHLLLTLLVLIALNRFRLVILLAGSNLLLLPVFMTTYYTLWSEQFGYDRQRIADFQEMVRSRVIYNPNTSNPWCNTLLFKLSERDRKPLVFPPELMAIHPGIGISFFLDPREVGPPPPREANHDRPLPPKRWLKSKYLLLDVETINHLPQTNTRILGYTPIGNLYLNLDADCP